jgi:hypothetical protein
VCDEKAGTARAVASITRLGTERELLQDLTARESPSIDDDLLMF